MTQELSAPTECERILELLVEQNTTEMMAPVNIIMSNCLLRCPPGQAGVGGGGEKGGGSHKKGRWCSWYPLGLIKKRDFGNSYSV